MRVTTLIRRVLGVTGLVVDGFEFGSDGLVVAVRPRWRRPRCGVCGRRAPGYDRRPARRWRHLGLGRLRIWLEYAPQRVTCRRCSRVRTERVPWAAHRSRFTREFEELAAYLAQVTDKTKVTELLGISWPTVGAIVERVVKSRLDPKRLQGLRRIGIDEFSYRKRHRYLTIVVDHDRQRVVWAAPDRTAATVGAFCDELGEAGCREIACVTIDMAGGYLKAVRERLPQAEVVFDRFHVQRLASDAVDAVRRSQVRYVGGAGTETGRAIKGSRFALLKNPWDLTRKERQTLSELQRTNARLYRAYLLKETLAHALDYRQPWRAEGALKEWLAWASRSRLAPFVKAAKTIRKHFDGILAYVHERLTNGIVEGFNNKLRMIARRAFGFHSPEPLIAMLYLCCGGIQLNPPLPRPTRT